MFSFLFNYFKTRNQYKKDNETLMSRVANLELQLKSEEERRELYEADQATSEGMAENALGKLAKMESILQDLKDENASLVESLFSRASSRAVAPKKRKKTKNKR